MGSRVRVQWLLGRSNMAAEGDNECCTAKVPELEELVKLVWGGSVKEDVFKRWSQGFVFSSDEPSALVQEQGGPCAVLAAAQAFFLKQMLFADNMTCPENWNNITDAQCQELLACTLCEMLNMVEENEVILVFLKDNAHTFSTICADGSNLSTASSDSGKSTECCSPTTQQELSSMSSGDFHSSLRQTECHSKDHVKAIIQKNVKIFEGHFGVLIFLYSLILSKGLDQIKMEMEEAEALIEDNHGIGSQALINLLLTGHAVSNVWDSSRTVSGLELRGVPQQSTVGFLTLLEALRYCEVGSFFKCPVYPIWVLASESHLTVFFSQETSLTRSESEKDKGRRIFKTYDQQENGFIETDKLANVLSDLGLVTEPEYVSFMVTRLDPDQMGIILLQNFLQEFFPGEDLLGFEDTRPFTVYHYNGLGTLTDDSSRKVVYIKGVASVEPTDFSHIGEQQILSCLKTRWPGISVDWQAKHPPSIN